MQRGAVGREEQAHEELPHVRISMGICQLLPRASELGFGAEEEGTDELS